MNDFSEQVGRAISEHALFRKNQSVLVAVSGGPDSMVLLHLLARLAPAQGWKLTIAHFNHRLRGRSSDADERFVEATSGKLNLPYVSGRADVRKFARDQKQSLEMAARQLRHEFLAWAARQQDIFCAALGHNADDQAELFFLRLLRGSGTGGLAGMKWRGPSPADGELTLVRPLLAQPKEAILAFAKAEGVRFRVDATNAAWEIQRNRIRHELFPLLTKKYQPALARVILRQMDILGAENEFLERTAEEWLENANRPGFATLPLALKRRVLQAQLTRLEISPNFDLIEQLREFAGAPVEVEPGKTVLRDLAGLVHLRNVEEPRFRDAEYALRFEGAGGTAEFGSLRVEWQFVAPPTVAALRTRKSGLNCEHLDAGKVGPGLRLRHWRPGDRFQPMGMKSAAKLQNILTNNKIPRDERHGLVVAANDAGKLVWVEGLRLSEQFKVEASTLRCLQWRWKRL